jgi:hypothetical protein
VEGRRSPSSTGKTAGPKSRRTTWRRGLIWQDAEDYSHALMHVTSPRRAAIGTHTLDQWRRQLCKCISPGQEASTSSIRPMIRAKSSKRRGCGPWPAPRFDSPMIQPSRAGRARVHGEKALNKRFPLGMASMRRLHLVHIELFTSVEYIPGHTNPVAGP